MVWHDAEFRGRVSGARVAVAAVGVAVDAMALSTALRTLSPEAWPSVEDVADLTRDLLPEGVGRLTSLRLVRWSLGLRSSRT